MSGSSHENPLQVPLRNEVTNVVMAATLALNATEAPLIPLRDEFLRQIGEIQRETNGPPLGRYLCVVKTECVIEVAMSHCRR